MARVRRKWTARTGWLITALAATTPLFPVAAETGHAPGSEAAPYRRVLAKEAGSRVLCESRTDRVFVSHRLGTECVAFFVTRGAERDRRAVIFLDGDLKPEKMADDSQAKILSAQQIHLQRLADASGLRFIAISRPGVLGSSGNHGERRKTAEMLSVNGAIDVLKARLGLERIAVAGQSGGSTIAAALLTMGRQDISCAVLGSGNLAVVDRHLARAVQEGRKLSREAVARTFYDPSSNLTGIVADAGRRIFVLGDPNDQVTPFGLQQQFAAGVQALGHHVRVVAIAATGLENHGSVHRSLPAAAQCLAGRSDEQIVARASQRISLPPVATAPPAVVAAPSAAEAAVPRKEPKPVKEELSI